MKPSTKFWLWAGSCFVSFILGDTLGVFSYNLQVRDSAKMQPSQMQDGKKALILKVEHPWDRRYHQDLSYTFIESGNGDYLSVGGIMKRNVDNAKAHRPNDLTRVIEEIIDSNQNGSYDTQRVFYEDSIKKDLVSEQAIGEINKKDLPLYTYPDERRLE